MLKWGGSRSILSLVIFYILQTYCLYPALFIRCHRRATEIPKKNKTNHMFMFTSSCFTIDQKDGATAVSWATLSKISRMRFLTLHCYLTQIVTETETHYFSPLACVFVWLCGEKVSHKRKYSNSERTLSTSTSVFSFHGWSLNLVNSTQITQSTAAEIVPL